MKKKLLVLSILFLIILSGCSQQVSVKTFDEQLCSQIIKQDSGCDEVFHVDLNSNLVFYENKSNLMYARINDNFSEIESVNGSVDLTALVDGEYPLFWAGLNSFKEEFSMIMGIANNNVKTIIIESEITPIQPNHIRIGDNLWLWYQVFNNAELNQPIIISGYDENGNKLYGN